MNNLLLGLVLTFSCISLHAQEAEMGIPKEHISFFNTYELQSMEKFPMLDTILPKFKFFFTAEEHWLEVNSQIQYEFLVFLHKHAGVRNLIVEGGYSYGFMLNQYLKTGKDYYLQRAVHNPPMCENNLIEFYRKIYAYNKRFPPLERIQVFGIDLEQSPLLAINCLNEMLPDKPLSAGVKDKMEQLMRYQLVPDNLKEIRKYFRQLHKEVQIRRRAYKRYWGSQYWLFKMILDNTIQGFDSPFLRDFIYAHSDQKKREEALFRNFSLLYKNNRFRKGNFYAQFGGIHTELNPAINWGYQTLAQRLNFDRLSPMKDQVLSFSKYFRRVKRIYERFDEYERFSFLMDQLVEKMKTDFALVKMSDHPKLFPNISKDFQYILLIKPDKEINRCN